MTCDNDIMNPETTDPVWAEYDAAAQWSAAYGYEGKPGEPLPSLISASCLDAINYDVEAFQERVRAFAYARAMDVIADRFEDASA